MGHMRRTFFILTLLILSGIYGCRQDSGTGGNVGPAPRITGINPTVVNPGTIGVEGRIIGSNFESLMSVNMGDGVIVEDFQRLSNSEIYIFFSVARDTYPGPRTVVVATNTGAVSAPSLFNVGDNRLPEALFSVVPFRGIKDTPFRFDASKSNDDGGLVSYKWKFGDGKQDTGKVVTHRYSRGGNFIATLTITDNKNESVSSTRFIEVDASKAPIARFNVSPSSGSLDTVFSFDGSSSNDPDGRIAHYFWNFGDGSSGSGALVQHKFKRAGGLGVALTVTDNTGESNVTSKRVDISGGGPGPGPGPNPGPGTTCTSGSGNRGLIFGSVVGVSGNSAIVQFPPGSTCANTFYNCGDMRKANTSGRDEFYGIIRSMTDLGNGQFSILNDCPINWPPAVGQQIFLIFKTCSNNFCPS
jgi:hypothetical protein